MKHILHVGMPKTGSSSIHRTLLHVPPQLGVRYMHDHGVNLSRVLATICMEEPEEFPANRRRGRTRTELLQERKKLQQAIAEGLADPQASAVIMSAEMLTGLEAGAIKTLADWLRPLAPELQVVSYVRDPFSFVDSMFQTAVRNGKGKFNLGSHYPDYAKRFRKLEQAFGRKSIRYFAYEPATFVQGDVVQDFAARLNLDASDWQTRRTNVSMSKDAVCLLYMYRKLGPAEPRGAEAVQATARFMRLLETLQGNKARLAREVVQPVIDEKAKDIAWMEKRLGAPFAALPDKQDERAIRSEDDLLVLTDNAFEWLRLQGESLSSLGTPAKPNVPAISEAMHRLYLSAFEQRSPPKVKPLQKTL
jgi:hypothetical protein